MRIGILETGRLPRRLAAHGPFDAMFRRLLGPDNAYTTYAVLDGVLPDDPASCDGWVITGSAAGAYDELPWIAALEGFLRQARGHTKLVGICFGHQIMAQAFGGTVVKSDRGWGLGVHEYAIRERLPWMDEAATIAVPVSHQDQVVVPPPGARVIAASDFTPIAGLAYDDGRAISFQCHPEFDATFAAELVGLRRPEEFDDARRAAALASCGRPTDNARLGRWINRFLADAPAA